MAGHLEGACDARYKYRMGDASAIQFAIGQFPYWGRWGNFDLLHERGRLRLVAFCVCRVVDRGSDWLRKKKRNRDSCT